MVWLVSIKVRHYDHNVYVDLIVCSLPYVIKPLPHSHPIMQNHEYLNEVFYFFPYTLAGLLSACLQLKFV